MQLSPDGVEWLMWSREIECVVDVALMVGSVSSLGGEKPQSIVRFWMWLVRAVGFYCGRAGQWGKRTLLPISSSVCNTNFYHVPKQEAYIRLPHHPCVPWLIETFT